MEIPAWAFTPDSPAVYYMEGKEMRTSDRLLMEVAIVISGTDPAGRKFVEKTKALVLNRRGAEIVSRQSLAPQQKITIRCVKTGLETAVRVVGPIQGAVEGCHFGVAFLDPEVNIWGIEFPLLDGTQNPAGRLVLECADCHAQEVVHLDVLELQVFHANDCLIRSCPRCKKATLWMRFEARVESTPHKDAAPRPLHAMQERKHPRINVKVDVCLRHPQYGEEVVSSENISRGGFRVISHRDYPLGTVVDAALPYSPRAANIFTPARIVYKEGEGEGRPFAYGFAYIPSPLAPSLTGLRIAQNE